MNEPSAKGSRITSWLTVVGALAATLSSGCFRRIDLTQSSLDHNHRRPHGVVVAARGIAEVRARLIGIAEQRGLLLIEQHHCGSQSCLLVFRSGDAGPKDRASSRYYSSIRRAGAGRFAVAVVGVPVVRGVMACPLSWRRARRCRARSVTPIGNIDLSKDVGRDVTGGLEAERIAEVLGRLKLARFRPLPRPPATRPKPAKIVAVLDIEDRSSLGRSAIGQLSRYLAARIAAQPTFRLIPPDNVRSELSRRRRDSYRPCFEKRCQIELGKALAADRLLATTLLRVGAGCVVTSLLYDLRTEATERAASVRSRCDQTELLGSIDEMVDRLATSPPSPAMASSTNQGSARPRK